MDESRSTETPQIQQEHWNQKNHETEFCNITYQIDEAGVNARYTEIHQKFNFENIRDLICILIDLIPNYGAKYHRIISGMIYLMLRLLFFPFEKFRDILTTLELMDISQSWVNTI